MQVIKTLTFETLCDIIVLMKIEKYILDLRELCPSLLESFKDFSLLAKSRGLLCRSLFSKMRKFQHVENAPRGARHEGTRGAGNMNPGKSRER